MKLCAAESIDVGLICSSMTSTVPSPHDPCAVWAAFLGPLWCCADNTERVACAACQSGTLETGATQSALSALLHAAAGACLVLWCIALFVCKLLTLVSTCVVLRVMRAVVCYSIAIMSTHSVSAVAYVSRKVGSRLDAHSDA